MAAAPKSAKKPSRRRRFQPKEGIKLADIAERLNDHTDAIVGRLFPHAVKAGGYWQIGDLKGNKGDSLYIHRTGAKAGNWVDNATGQYGDLLDLVRETTGRTRGDTVLWAKAYLGIEGDAKALPALAGSRQHRDAGDDRNRSAALKLWAQSSELAGTVAEKYLRSRAIFGDYSKTLRFMPSLKIPGTKIAAPALIAAVSGPDHKITAIQRIWLKPDGTGKAEVPQAKMTLGPLRAGAVRLGPVSAKLGLAEGVETAQSAMELSGTPTWAALGTRMHAITIPDQVTHLTIFADAGAPGERAARAAAEAHVKPGRLIEILRPAHDKDFNDLAQRLKREGLAADQVASALPQNSIIEFSSANPIEHRAETSAGQHQSMRADAPIRHVGGTEQSGRNGQMNAPQLTQVRSSIAVINEMALGDPERLNAQRELAKTAKGIDNPTYAQLDPYERATLSAARTADRESYGWRRPESPQLAAVREPAGVLSRTQPDDPARSAREGDLAKAARNMSAADYRALDNDQRQLVGQAREAEKEKAFNQLSPEEQTVKLYAQARRDAAAAYGKITGHDYSEAARMKAVRHPQYPEYDAHRQDRNRLALTINENREAYSDALGKAGITSRQLDDDVKSAMSNKRQLTHPDQVKDVKEAVAQLTRLNPEDKDKLAQIADTARGMTFKDMGKLSKDEREAVAFARDVTRADRQQTLNQDRSIDSPSRADPSPSDRQANTPDVADLREKIRAIKEFPGPAADKSALERQALDIEKGLSKDQLGTLTKAERNVLSTAAEKHLGVQR